MARNLLERFCQERNIMALLDSKNESGCGVKYFKWEGKKWNCQTDLHFKKTVTCLVFQLSFTPSATNTACNTFSITCVSV